MLPQSPGIWSLGFMVTLPQSPHKLVVTQKKADPAQKAKPDDCDTVEEAIAYVWHLPNTVLEPSEKPRLTAVLCMQGPALTHTTWVATAAAKCSLPAD